MAIHQNNTSPWHGDLHNQPSKGSIFDERQGVLSSDETLCWMLDIAFQTQLLILEGEIKDAIWAVIHLISKHSFNFNFYCIFVWII